MDSKAVLEDIGFEFCGSLLDEGASYASIILSKDGKLIHSHSTNALWEQLYHESGYSKSCHLFNATKILSKKNDNFIIFWDTLTPQNEISTYLNAKRDEKNICHGVSFCNKNKAGFVEIITLAGRRSDINFASKVIQNKSNIDQFLDKAKVKIILNKAPV